MFINILNIAETSVSKCFLLRECNSLQSPLQEVKEPCVQLRLKVKNPDTDTVESSAFTVDSDKFRVLVSGKYILYVMN